MSSVSKPGCRYTHRVPLNRDSCQWRVPERSLDDVIKADDAESLVQRLCLCAIAQA
jgi:hypothetical protein